MCPDGLKARLSISAAFPAKPLRPPVTCFRRKQIYSTITAIELHVPVAFATAPAAKHVQEFHLIPLFSEQEYVSRPDRRGRVNATKAGVRYSTVLPSYTARPGKSIPFLRPLLIGQPAGEFRCHIHYQGCQRLEPRPGHTGGGT